MSQPLYAGTVAPHSLRFRVTIPDADLSAAIAATIHVQRPNGIEEQWPAGILSKSATLVVIERLLQPTDIPARGQYRFYATIDVPGGNIRSLHNVVLVEAKFGS